MQNKENFKKCISRFIIISLIFLITIMVINYLEYNDYKINYNNKLNTIFYMLEKDGYSKTEIMEFLSSDKEYKDVLINYGLDKEIDNLISINSKIKNIYFTTYIVVIIMFIIVVLLIIYKYANKMSDNILEITELIKKINNRNYELGFDHLSIDELSILRSEIYKTMILLKEDAITSKNDKNSLKMSLEDISHQIKTPLTSILIMLDNLENNDIKLEEKINIIRNIRREVNNINNLVTNLLKLSKLDTNTITFNRKENSLKEIINKSVENVSIICDLKNIKINTIIDKEERIVCDKLWQIEAITNILKNACEHSYENKDITIELIDKKLYKMITIKNIGDSIDKKDISKIFNRFISTGKNSFGIGLALSKKVIENDNGKVSLVSNDGETTFTVKYFV